VDLEEVPLAVRFLTSFVPRLAVVRRRHVPAAWEEQALHGPQVLRNHAGIAIRDREDDRQAAGRADGAGVGIADGRPPLQPI
jgi:hypothetical protein